MSQSDAYFVKYPFHRARLHALIKHTDAAVPPTGLHTREGYYLVT